MKIYNCQKCEYETNVKEHMEEHMRYHDGFVVREVSSGYVIRERPK
jgi:hypothetical protein